MILTRPRWSSVLLVLAMILSAGVAGALFAQIPASDAAPGSGERSVTETITPCRILETRGPSAGGPIGVPLAGPLGQGQTLTLQVAGANGSTGQGPCTIATGLSGAVLNVTAVNATADSFLTVFPCDAPQRPNSSTLNPFPNRITFNSAVADLSATGTVCIFNNAGTVDVVVDVTGILYDHNHDDRYFTETEITDAFGSSIEWIAVNSDGSIDRQSGGMTVQRNGVGNHDITTTHASVTQCVSLVSSMASNVDLSNFIVALLFGVLNATDIQLRTFHLTNEPGVVRVIGFNHETDAVADMPFVMLLLC